MDVNDVINAVSERIKTPFFGYWLTAFIAFNWQAIFILATVNDTAYVRLEEFFLYTNNLKLYVYPLLTAVFLSLITPWINALFNFTSQLPFHWNELFKLKQKDKLDLAKFILDAKKEANIQKLKAKNIVQIAQETEILNKLSDSEEIKKAKDELNELKQDFAATLESLKNQKNIPEGKYSEILKGLNPFERLILRKFDYNTGKLHLARLRGIEIDWGIFVLEEEVSNSLNGINELNKALGQLLDKNLISNNATTLNQVILYLTSDGYKVLDLMVKNKQ